jgi:succinate dehydrogenase hydrophobic anchor subunit
VNRRRLLLLGLGVTALLAVAAIASSGRPLARSHAAGPSASFFDYVFTTTAIFYIAMTLIVIYALIVQKRIPFEAPKRRWRLLSTFASLLLVGVVVLIAMHNGLGQRIRDLNLRANPQQAGKGTRPGAENKLGRNAHLRWDEIAVVLALIAGTGVLLYVGKGAKRTPRPWRVRSKEAVSLALDESLDDLRNERDLRRAIIAAYARMEHALAVGGMPRRPSEAPFEYVERALGELETSAASARRLTDLFEWAKFSHHEPGPEMRDEAIDALVAVRDELRRPAVEAVA